MWFSLCCQSTGRNTQKQIALKQYRKGRNEAKPEWGLQEYRVSKGQVAGEGDTSAES